jgi:hypothetical protein
MSIGRDESSIVLSVNVEGELLDVMHYKALCIAQSTLLPNAQTCGEGWIISMKC